MLSPFEASSLFYDLLYEEKDSIKEAKYVHNLISKYKSNDSKSVLEFGSGTGRHGRLLGDLGYKVHGVEKSNKMINLARKTENFSCEQGDITNVKLLKEYDYILSLFHVMSYQTSNNDVKAIFNSANIHLKKGGLFIFDFWYSPAVAFQKPSVKVKNLSNSQYSIVRIAEPSIFPNENKVEVNYTFIIHNKNSDDFQTFKEIHPMRHFSIPELQLYISEAGFENLLTEEWLTAAKPSENTWGVCMVLRKK